MTGVIHMSTLTEAAELTQISPCNAAVVRPSDFRCSVQLGPTSKVTDDNQPSGSEEAQVIATLTIDFYIVWCLKPGVHS